MQPVVRLTEEHAMRLIIEGWSFLPHSYGVVDQFLSLELSRRAEVELFHRDIPFVDPAVTVHPATLGDAGIAARLARIPKAFAGQSADATLRLFVPLNFSPVAGQRTLVFGTAEFGILDPRQIGQSSVAALNAATDLALLTPSQWSRSGLIRGGADPDKIAVIPHGIDPDIFHPIPASRREAIRRDLGWGDGFIFLNVGALTGNKGIVELLKSFAVMATEFPKARLVLKGLDDIYRSNLSLKACLQSLLPGEREKIEPRLIYIGTTLTYAQTAALYQAADAYVSPYRAEGFNLPVLEAAACGLPVVCTGGGPTDEFIEPSFSLRIESRLQRAKIEGLPTALELAPSLENLSLQMRRVLVDRDWGAHAKLAGPPFVLGRFTWRHAVDQLLALLSDPHAAAWKARPFPGATVPTPQPNSASNEVQEWAWTSYRNGDRDAARRLCRDVLRLHPLHADTIYLLGVLATDDGRQEEALLHFHQAASLRPDSARFHNTLGEMFHAIGRRAEAEQCFNAAASVQPEYERAHLNLGLLLHANGDLHGAAIRFAEALRLNPNYATAHNNLGGVLQAQDRIPEAVAHFRRALELRPDYPEAHFNLGSALQAMGNPATAVGCFREAIRLRPHYARAHSLLGQSLVDLGQLAASVSSFQASLKINPEDIAVYARLADVLRLLDRMEDAAKVLDAALHRRPQDPQCLAHRFRLRSEVCDWRNWHDEAQSLWNVTQVELRAGRASPVHPMFAMSLPWTGAQQLAIAKNYSRGFDRFVLPATVHAAVAPGSGKKIRVGYLSRDFYDHPVAHQMQALFGLHDRDRFEIHAYSFGPDDASVYRQRIARECEHFHDVATLPLADLTRQIREHGIQILVDLMGYSGLARTACLASRPAPVQVSWLGYPGTMGADFIDYIIGDSRVTPIGNEATFSEKIVRLPHSYMVTDHEQPIDATPTTRAEHGLPPDAIVFCCFNNAHKIDPDIFGVWMRILSNVPGSVAWMSVREKTAQRNLCREAQARGIHPNRLVFAPHVKSKAAHLARLRLADLFLDTRIYNAHATACDALWAGLPLLTCPADTFASRVGSSLLTAIGLPELIMPDLAHYERMAVHLARHPEERNKLRAKLSVQRHKAPLFDTQAFVRSLEDVYRVMWESYVRDQPQMRSGVGM